MKIEVNSYNIKHSYNCNNTHKNHLLHKYLQLPSPKS